MRLAHHLEMHHVPVLVCLFAAGFYIGWQAVSRLLPRRVRAQASSHSDRNRPAL
jgi:hypothetical protein